MPLVRPLNLKAGGSGCGTQVPSCSCSAVGLLEATLQSQGRAVFVQVLPLLASHSGGRGSGRNHEVPFNAAEFEYPGGG